MLSNVLTAKAISGALLSSYLTQCIKNNNSVATTPLQFRRGMYNFVTELSNLLCDVFANYTFWHTKYELSLTIDIGLLHMYHSSVLPSKQHKIPLIVSRQISIPNVSPNLTDAHLGIMCVGNSSVTDITFQELFETSGARFIYFQSVNIKSFKAITKQSSWTK